MSQYCVADQSNSSIEKAGLLGSMPMRLLPTDDKCRLRGTTLEQAIKSDREKGLIPCYVSNITSAFKQTYKQTKDRTKESKPDTILAEHPNTVHTCSRHCVAADRLTSERTGSFIPLSKTFPPICAQSYLQSLRMFLKRTEKCLVAHAQCFPPDQFIFSHPCQHLASNFPTTIPFTCRSRPLKAQFTGNTTKSIKPLLTAIYEP
jgi:hypothetical protein